MKLALQIFIFSLCIQSVRAQQAPNLILSDLDGNTHNIHQILNSGKTVILDFFIENCLPCHESIPYMNDFYSNYGPAGTDNVEVLSIETYQNSSESVDALSEEWGITNPVINLDAVPEAYASIVEGYPYYVVICPDSTFVDQYDFNYPNTNLFWAQSTNQCKYDNNFTDVSIISNTVVNCQDYTKAYLEIANTGTELISELELRVFSDSGYDDTLDLALILPPLSTSSQLQQDIIIEQYEDTDIIGFEIIVDNDVNSANNISTHNLSNEIVAYSNLINIKIQLDNYPNDLEWKLTDENGIIMIEGYGSDFSPYTLVDINLALDTSICYEFSIIDNVGDGICCSFGEGYYQLSSQGEELYFNDTFSSSLTHLFHISNTEFNISESKYYSKTPIETIFYNIKGQEILQPNSFGFYIEKKIYEDGSSSNRKLVLLGP
jgi:thiol-disulfide isomerase/thioredoxin